LSAGSHVITALLSPTGPHLPSSAQLTWEVIEPATTTSPEPTTAPSPSPSPSASAASSVASGQPIDVAPAVATLPATR
jgi:hypothetical protein